ncbi:uncharacterized protein LOC117898839 [Drosophila subobscura]|uniref:uncharacterized protein LOC117898839 n=1 Tax=Drosophila subobscura TaxID=7241 RepID=UPI00155AEFCF|nr:uncharacterized protein LOC117898839 [Drosophila subobscura]
MGIQFAFVCPSLKSNAYNKYGTQDAVVFKFTNFACESYNKSWIVFHNYRLKAVSRDKVLLNLNATLLNPAHGVTIRGRVLKRANGYKPWLFDVTFDACRFMRKQYIPIVSLVYGLFKQFTNINHTCPYVGPAIVKDFYLNPELLRLPFPTGDYLLAIRWFFEKKLVSDTNVSFVFVEDLLNS